MFNSQQMIRFICNSIILFYLVIPLYGCEDQLTYSYLQQHAGVLKQKVAECQSIDEKSSENIHQCQVVMNAAADLIVIINEQQDDPEKFGEKILTAETELAKTKSKLINTQQIVNDLITKKSPAPELQIQQKNLNQIKEAYRAQREQLRVLLSVVGMNSPE